MRHVVQVDLALAFLLQSMKSKRRDMRLVVMSATLQDALIKRVRQFMSDVLTLPVLPPCLQNDEAPNEVEIRWQGIWSVRLNADAADAVKILHGLRSPQSLCQSCMATCLSHALVTCRRGVKCRAQLGCDSMQDMRKPPTKLAVPGFKVILEALDNSLGNVLVFLPGAADIRAMCRELEACAQLLHDWNCLAIHALHLQRPFLVQADLWRMRLKVQNCISCMCTLHCSQMHCAQPRVWQHCHTCGFRQG